MATEPTPWTGEDEPELPAWLRGDDRWEDDDEPTDRRLGRGRLLAVLAAIPWLIALVVLLRSADDPEMPPTPDGAPAAAATHGTASPPVDDAAGADDPARAASRSTATAADADGSSTAEASGPGAVGGPRTTVTGADAVAMATAVARAWLTGVGPELTVTGVEAPGSVYAEHLVAEAIDHPSPGFAVVTLLAVVLSVEDGAYGDAAVQRIAVPIGLDPRGARPAGSPWLLPAPDLSPTAVERSPVDDEEVALQAATAVTAAGYTDVELLSLDRTGSWPLIATLRAIAPGRSGPEQHEVWLRPHLDGLVVAGWLPAHTTTPTEDRP